MGITGGLPAATSNPPVTLTSHHRRPLPPRETYPTNAAVIPQGGLILRLLPSSQILGAGEGNGGDALQRLAAPGPSPKCCRALPEGVGRKSVESGYLGVPPSSAQHLNLPSGCGGLRSALCAGGGGRGRAGAGGRTCRDGQTYVGTPQPHLCSDAPPPPTPELLVLTYRRWQ